MKISVHDTESQALEENQRLMGLLNIPDGSVTINYSSPVQIDGKWCLILKEFGPWKADHISVNVQDVVDVNL